jgi:hypothetical protein
MNRVALPILAFVVLSTGGRWPVAPGSSSTEDAALLIAARSAIGTEAALDGVTSLSIQGERRFASPLGGFGSGNQILLLAVPTGFHRTMGGLMGTMTQGFAGDTLIRCIDDASQGMAMGELSAGQYSEELRRMKFLATAVEIALLLPRRPALPVTYAAEASDSSNGTDALVVTGPDSLRFRVLLDKTTHRMLSLESLAPIALHWQQTGRDGGETWSFSDHRKVEQLTLPSSLVITTGKHEEERWDLKEITINAPLPADLKRSPTAGDRTIRPM